jgi:beta-glucosidase-like glycosyl hydrolase
MRLRRLLIVPAVAVAVTGAAVLLPVGSAGAAGASTALLARLSLEQRVGQLLMVGVPATGPTAAQLDLVARYHVGSVILTGRSSLGTAATSDISARLQAQATTATNAGVPLLISTDQEGGAVQVLSGPGFSTMPSALVQGTESTSTLRQRARTWGGQLRSAGVRVDLAPVADTVPAGADNPPIGNFDRQYGSTPATVSSHAGAFAAGMEDAGIIPTVKHFPGLGRVTRNTDTSSGVTDTVTTRTDAYLAPFASASRTGSPFVMMSTAIYSRIDPANPAAFSPTVLGGMLRGDLGFDGVVVSDDLGNAVQVAAYTPGERATRFVAAGGDLVLTVSTARLPAMYDALLTRARADAGFRARVAQSAGRVLLAKQRLGLLGRASLRGDFGGDGIAERTVFRPSTGTWYAQGRTAVRYGVSGDVPVPADYTGDGRTDLAVYRPSTHTWYVRGRSPVAYGVRGDIPVPADYTGDGRVDIALYRPSTGTWYVYGRPAASYGEAGDVPVPADYTGDGIADLAVFRPSDGSWRVRGVATLVWGRSGDVPVPGDWTGDGIADRAVYRPSDTTWYVRGGARIGYGQAGDVLVPADYTGDGRLDPALYRPTTHVWYVYGRAPVTYGVYGDQAVLDVTLLRRPR